jgi:transposase-like protein
MNQTPAKARRKFDDVFRREALNHWVNSGQSAETIARELGINANQLYAWKQRFAPAAAGAAGAKPATLAEAQAQLEAAQREIRHLREQRDILKKTLGILSEPPPSASNGSTR